MRCIYKQGIISIGDNGRDQEQPRLEGKCRRIIDESVGRSKSGQWTELSACVAYLERPLNPAYLMLTSPNMLVVDTYPPWRTLLRDAFEITTRQGGTSLPAFFQPFPLIYFYSFLMKPIINLGQ